MGKIAQERGKIMKNIETAKNTIRKYAFHKSMIGDSEWLISVNEETKEALELLDTNISINSFIAANGNRHFEYVMSNNEFDRLLR